MKKVIYSQRVEVVEHYNERRDCADQKIPRLIEMCGFIPIPMPNVIENVDMYLKAIEPDGIMLTGGNSLSQWGGTAPERDTTDEKLIRFAVDNSIPLYGFCRGMQSILNYFDCELSQVQGHVAVKHELYIENSAIKSYVNSFHNQGCIVDNVRRPLIVAAYTVDGVAEWIKHETLPIEATMWHPERENPFAESDIQRIKKLFRWEGREQ